ncbi:recombinase family protein [Microbacterium sp.]|uniref:recombinase family protein n=1 Tax=Microbacterium sp. TaxID=51671 RepID=UPI00391B2A26
MSAQLFGLARVSTEKQALDRQLDALHSFGVPGENIVTEKGVSGAAAHRAGLDALMLRVRPGDTVVAHDLSRLGRRTLEVVGLVRALTGRGVDVRILQPGLVFDGSPLSNLLLSVMSAIHEMELETTRQRTVDGLAAARARGRVGGRPEALTNAQRAEVVRMRAEGRPAAEVAALFDCSIRTIRRCTQRRSS